MNNNKKNSIFSHFELSLPANQNPSLLMMMVIRGAPHFFILIPLNLLLRACSQSLVYAISDLRRCNNRSF